MKILVHDYAGHAFAAELSRELALRGHEAVHAWAGGLLTPRGDLQARPGDPPWLRFVEVPMAADYRRAKYDFLRRRGFEVAYGRRLREFVAAESPDVVLSGNTPTEPQWMMVQAARRLGIPVVTWVQDFYSLAVTALARRRLPVIGALAGALYRRLDQRCFAASARIVAISHDFVPALVDFGVPAAKVTVIPNWAPLRDLPLRARNNPWAQAAGLENRFVFLYSGTLAMKHDPRVLEMLARRFAGDPRVVVVVVSEGPGAEYLRARARSGGLANLRLFPFQPFSSLPEVLAAGDVLVAILEEGAGRFSVPSKILAYHCAGRPILAMIPPENLAARVLRVNVSGACFNPGDHAGFLEAAMRMLEEPAWRESMAENARGYAEETFNIETITSSFESVLERAVRGAELEEATASDRETVASTLANDTN